MADLLLPELPTAPSGPLHIRLASTAIEDWPADHAAPALLCHDLWEVQRHRQSLGISREGIGEFLLTEDGDTMLVRRAPDVSERIFRGAIIDHALPLALAHQGHLIAHAGTVACGARALCLLGPSGTGKSTLTVACEAAGFDLLGDDSVRLIADGDGVRCAPAYSGARLKPDSVAALALTERIDEQPCGLIPKYRYRPILTAGAGLATPLPALAAIVHLERATDGANPGTIELEQVPLTEAAALLTAQCFVLDPTDLNRLRRLLAQTAATVARVPVYRLRYPSGYGHLPAVCDRLAGLLDTG